MFCQLKSEVRWEAFEVALDRLDERFRLDAIERFGEAIEELWRNWRRHDPINLVSKYRAILKSLRGITIDCGWRDGALDWLRAAWNEVRKAHRPYTGEP